jgi:hypothetical protein
VRLQFAHLVASRPAKVGDKLVATPFVNSITRGFDHKTAPQKAARTIEV